MAIVATVQTYPQPIAVPGDTKAGTAEITFTGTTDYVTNGVSPIAAILLMEGWSQVLDIHLSSIGPSLSAGIFAASWDATNQKVKLWTSAAAEVANAANISTIKCYFYVRGR